MAKSNKATVLRRVNDVGRLILAGAEFAEIRQYASDQGWQVSQRQIRRYMERCYKRLAQTTERNRKELLGRHLMQRRAIYARSLKNNDLRTALQTLRDEAELEGLYPPAHVSAELALKQSLGMPSSSPLTRKELVARQLAAEAKEDKKELAILKSLTPVGVYQFPSTIFPIMFLHTATLLYIQEQLEQLATFLHGMWRVASQEDETDADSFWGDIALVAAYRYRIGLEAWRQFLEELGIDEDQLMNGNYRGMMLEFSEGPLSLVTPSMEQMPEILARLGHSTDSIVTARDLLRSWNDLFDQVGRD